MKSFVLAFLLAGRALAQSEIDTIYNEDQKDREANPTGIAAVTKIIERDAGHRKRVRDLLAAGALTSGKDFEKAAYVFQHGDTSDDFLLAHILAMVAVKKGNGDAIWIAAATLDRYLNKIGKAQVLGTQFHFENDSPWTQEPYDRALISDALRRALNVPIMAEQAKTLEEMKKAQAAASK